MSGALRSAISDIFTMSCVVAPPYECTFTLYSGRFQLYTPPSILSPITSALFCVGAGECFLGGFGGWLVWVGGGGFIVGATGAAVRTGTCATAGVAASGDGAATRAATIGADAAGVRATAGAAAGAGMW